MNDGTGNGRAEAGALGDPDHSGSPAPGEACDLAAAKAGDPAAFGRLYDRHAAVVLSLCRRGAGGGGGVEADAEDALQETFVRAHRLLHKFEGTGLGPWLYAIARRVCSEQRRARSRRLDHEGRAAMERGASGMSTGASASMSASTRTGAGGGGDAPIQGLQREEALARLTCALDRLAERERLAVHLHYLEADPVAAAASTLGVSRSGYYKLLARARDQLAALMQEVQPS